MVGPSIYIYIYIIIHRSLSEHRVSLNLMVIHHCAYLNDYNYNDFKWLVGGMPLSYLSSDTSI